MVQSYSLERLQGISQFFVMRTRNRLKSIVAKDADYFLVGVINEEVEKFMNALSEKYEVRKKVGRSKVATMEIQQSSWILMST